MEKKHWTNVHVGLGFSVKSKFKVLMTIDEARDHGRKEYSDKQDMKYLGVMGVDITQKELNKILKDYNQDKVGV